MGGCAQMRSSRRKASVGRLELFGNQLRARNCARVPTASLLRRLAKCRPSSTSSQALAIMAEDSASGSPSSGASASFKPNAQNQQRKEVVEKTVALTSLLKLYDPEEQIFETAPAAAE